VRSIGEWKKKEGGKERKAMECKRKSKKRAKIEI